MVHAAARMGALWGGLVVVGLGCTARTGFGTSTTGDVERPSLGDPSSTGGDAAAGDASGGDAAIGPQPAATKIVAGYNHTCALLPEGRVKCWGRNLRGQLGVGHTDDVGDEPGEMGARLGYVNFGTDARAVDIGAGQAHSCASLESGQIRCWGEAAAGNLGNEDSETRGDYPGETAGTANVLKQPVGLTPVRMGVSKRNVCVLYDDDSLRCNGQGDYGQLGNEAAVSVGARDGEMGDALLPIDLGGGVAVTHFAMGDYHVCAVTDLPGVKCWGRGHYGRLGLGSTSHWGGTSGSMGGTLPYVSLGATDVPVAMVRSYYGSCARLASGQFKCWGGNLHGELGLGNTNSIGDGGGEMGAALAAVEPGFGRAVAAIAGGAHFWCLVLSDRNVLCAGRNAGALGQGTVDDYGNDPGETWAALSPIDFGAGRRLATASSDSLATGLNHACAALDDGTVRCWGNNDFGQLGVGDTQTRGDEPGEMGTALVPVDLSGDGSPGVVPLISAPATAPAAQLSVGYSHACVLFDDGRVKCWGENYFGQLGTATVQYYGNDPGEMGASLPFVDLGAGRTAINVAAGAYHTCAILDDGTVKCWGAGLFGARGSGDELSVGFDSAQMGDNLPVVPLPVGLAPVRIEAGYFHTCVLMNDDQLYCWGFGTDGQVGALGAPGHRGDEPGEMGAEVLPIDFGAGRTVVDFDLGERFLCVVTDEQRVKCVGRGTVGRLGSGNTTTTGTAAAAFGDNLSYVDLGVGELSVRVFAGQATACAEMEAGGFKCWGYNAGGQLGLGDVDARGDGAGEMGSALPAHLTGVWMVNLAVGGAHVCWMSSDSVRCLGGNDVGQLGHGTTVAHGDDPGESWSNVPVTDLGTSVALAEIGAGLEHTCARTADGRILCWGLGAGGPLGTGTSTNVGDQAGEMGGALQAVSF